MKIALIYPNNDRMVNRGTGYIATLAAKAGHDVTLYDTAYCSDEDVIRQVSASQPDLVLLSVSTMLYPRAKRMATQIKSLLPNVPILIGGIHVTITKGKVLLDCPAIDYACVGEGEDFISEFLSKLHTSDIRGIQNLAYRDDEGRVVVNPVRPCTDLNNLPPFNYTFWHQESIVRQGPKPGFTYVFATRGCPYRCTYCCNSCYLDLYGKSYLRTQNRDTIISELISLRDQHHAEFFYFGDEMILFDREYVGQLFRRVKEEVGLPFGCMTRVETINEKTIDLFEKTGCCYVSMGVECGDEQFRKTKLNRHMTDEQIYRAFDLLHTIPSMFIYAFFMHGFPFSYDDRLTEKTNEMKQRLKPDLVQDSQFYPLLGTELYDYCEKNDLIDHEKMNSTENYLRKSILKEVSYES
jgi:radical SAM superfamily enzyme YgiQ (UPF0313 family)